MPGAAEEQMWQTMPPQPTENRAREAKEQRIAAVVDVPAAASVSAEADHAVVLLLTPPPASGSPSTRSATSG